MTFPEGVPHLRPIILTPVPGTFLRVPQPLQDGVSHIQERMGYHKSRRGWGNPTPTPFWDRTRWGTPPPLSRTGYARPVTARAVRLLRFPARRLSCSHFCSDISAALAIFFALFTRHQRDPVYSHETYHNGTKVFGRTDFVCVTDLVRFHQLEKPIVVKIQRPSHQFQFFL